MLFKGTARRTALDIALQVDRVGGSINAFTDKETTCFYCTLPADHAELALDILCDMVSHASLAAEEIVKEKVVVSNEIRAAEDSPDEQGYQLYLEGLWRSHPLAARVAGVVADVERIEATKSRHLLPQPLPSAAPSRGRAGALEFDRIAHVFERESGARWGGGSRHVAADTDVLRVAGVHARSLSTGAGVPRHYPGTEHRSRHLPRPRAALHGLRRVDELAAVPAYPRGSGTVLFGGVLSQPLLRYLGLGIYANAMPELAPRLLAALNEELHRLADEPLSVREVDAAISHITGSMVFAKEDMETRMKRLPGSFRCSAG